MNDTLKEAAVLAEDAAGNGATTPMTDAEVEAVPPEDRGHTNFEGPAEVPGLELVFIEPGLIKTSPYQTRRFDAGRNKGVDQLAESIRANGQHQAALVRPRTPEGTHIERYEIVFGERRMRACAQIDAPLLCRVKELTDDQAREACITENLEREDLHPLEEAEGFGALLKAGWTQDRIAETFGHHKMHVARRVALNELIPDWKKLFADPDSPVRDWSIGHMHQIARLPAEPQKELAAAVRKKKRDYRDPEWESLTLVELRGVLADRINLLDAAVWDLDDAGLLSSAPACTSCPKRTSCTPELFDTAEFEETEKKSRRNGAELADRCLDGTCFDSKNRAWMKHRISDALEEHGGIRFVDSYYVGNHSDPKLLQMKPVRDRVTREGYVTFCKRGARGAVPVMKLGGPKAGTIQYAKVEKSYEEREAERTGKKVKGTTKKRTKSHNARCKEVDAARLDHIRKAIVEFLEPLGMVTRAFRGKDPAPPAPLPVRVTDSKKLAVIATFGTNYARHGRDGYVDARFKPWEAIERLGGTSQPTMIDQLFRSALDVLCTRLDFYTKPKSRSFDPDDLIVPCEILGIGYEGLRAQAELKHAYPKEPDPAKAKAKSKSKAKAGGKGGASRPKARKRKTPIRGIDGGGPTKKTKAAKKPKATRRKKKPAKRAAR